ISSSLLKNLRWFYCTILLISISFSNMERPKMRIETLEIYLAVVEAGSTALAARKCYLSQPAVSMAISSLENELGQRLLFRALGQHKPIVPTEAGILFADYARKALMDYDNIKASMIPKNDMHEPFILGISHTPSNLILPTLVNNFKKIYSNILFSVRTFPGYQMQHKLETSECDIAITSNIPTGNGFIYERFFYDPLVLIAPKSFNIKSPITASQIKSFPLVVREDTCNITKILTESFEREDISMNELNVVFQVYGNDAVMQAVSLGTGIGFVTKSVLSESRDDKNYDIINVKRFRVDRYLYLIRQTGSYSSEMKLFWDFAMKMKWRGNGF
ncbi:MAG TPA: LysR family transcriptional regulator, partial [Anaerovoracaceae bacterium]|nr:LysR family transcriptional regulator [Anaerovoracaceae bacterium]